MCIYICRIGNQMDRKILSGSIKIQNLYTSNRHWISSDNNRNVNRIWNYPKEVHLQIWNVKPLLPSSRLSKQFIIWDLTQTFSGVGSFDFVWSTMFNHSYKKKKMFNHTEWKMGLMNTSRETELAQMWRYAAWVEPIYSFKL